MSLCPLFCQLIRLCNQLLDYDYFDLNFYSRIASSSLCDGEVIPPPSLDRSRNPPVFRYPPRFRRPRACQRPPPSLSSDTNETPDHSQQRHSRACDTVIPGDIDHQQFHTSLLDQSPFLPTKEICIPFDFLKKEASALIELVLGFMARLEIERAMSLERLQGLYSHSMSLPHS